MAGITVLVLLCGVALVLADDKCSVKYDVVNSQLTLSLDTSMISKTGPPGPSGPPGTVSPDVLKKMEDRIASLVSQVKELKEKVGDQDDKKTGNCSDCKTFIKGNLVYWISATTMSWKNGDDFCKKTGGKLATKGVRKLRGQKQIIKELFHPSAYDTRTIAWIGFRDHEEEGKWIWEDRVVADKSNTDWYPGEPNNSGNQDCGTLREGLDGIDDDNCYKNYYVICSAKRDSILS